jgi:hypothetical protein
VHELTGAPAVSNGDFSGEREDLRFGAVLEIADAGSLPIALAAQ